MRSKQNCITKDHLEGASLSLDANCSHIYLSKQKRNLGRRRMHHVHEREMAQELRDQSLLVPGCDRHCSERELCV